LAVLKFGANFARIAARIVGKKTKGLFFVFLAKIGIDPCGIFPFFHFFSTAKKTER